MKTFIRIGVSLAVLAGLGACVSQNGLSPDFGNAVRHNMAVQVVNPDPVYGEPSTVNGVRVRDAYDRYQEGVVTPPAGVGLSGN